jgi:hypothetical protein
VRGRLTGAHTDVPGDRVGIELKKGGNMAKSIWTGFEVLEDIEQPCNVVLPILGEQNVGPPCPACW